MSYKKISAYNEAPELDTRWSDNVVTASAIDTRDYDAYRQGVELTVERHYYKGLVKIHAGETGHQLRQSNIGQSKLDISPEITFNDVATLSPTSFMSGTKSEFETIKSVREHAYDTWVQNCEQWNYTNYDGVLEPLTIRGKFPRQTSERPFYAHDIHATLETGNLDKSNGADLIVSSWTVEEVKDRPFNESESRASVSGSYIGYELETDIVLDVYRDDRDRSCARLSTSDTVLYRALAAMSASTDELAECFIYSSAGFTYSSGPGRDSISFGGMMNSRYHTASYVIY